MKRLLASLLLLLLPAIPALAQGFDPFGEAGIDEHPGARVPMHGRFLDASGKPTTLAAIAHGRPMLLVPVLHECPNLCGVTLAGLSDAIAAQPLKPGPDFALVAFGIDPKEPPSAAADDLARMRARAGAVATGDTAALVGPEATIRAVTDAIGFRYGWDARIRQYAHVAGIAVLTPDGRLSSWLYGVTPQPADLAKALATARAGRTGSWGDRLLLLCYHYDPQTGRYTTSIEAILRIAGAATVLAIGLLIWVLRRRNA